MSKTLTFLDKTFWLTESDANPKHVACVQHLRMPPEASRDRYVPELFAELRTFTKACSPFNCKVRSFLGYPLSLQPVKQLDMDYHVKLHRVADVTDKVAMDNFVAELHASRLDPERPLWQYHFIDDGKSDEFLIYARVHHMYGDGATLVRWFQAGYLPEPQTEEFIPIWAVKRLRHKRPSVSIVKRLWQTLVNIFLVTRDLLIIFLRLLMKLVRINTHYMPIPFSGTKTVLTGQVKPGRAVALMDIDFDRIKALSRRTRASVNEILLCAFDIGVHRLLQDHGQVFKKALYTNMPINLRKPGDKSTGNKIAIVPVQLAHAEQDPYLRLRQIINNHRIVKHAAQHSTPGAFSAYTVIIQSFALVFEWLRMSDLTKPIANILVSNVPGPEDRRYLKDSILLGNYPVSTITPGGGVNITIMTYAGSANIGLVCCNKHIKSLQPLAQYAMEAFLMMEACVDDPTLRIDDIGEHVEEVPLSIVSEH